MSAKVNITMRVKVGGSDRYVPVVIADNGRIRPEWAVIDGKTVRYPGGRYYIDWTDSGVRKRRAAGKSASQALAQQLRKEIELKAIEQGLTVTDEEGETRVRLVTAVATYLEEIKLTKKPKTLSAYSTALEYFHESCKKTYIDEIERSDMLRYAAYLRDEREQAPRTVRNKFENVMTFLKLFGKSKFMQKNDWPQFVEEEPEVYEKEDLEVFFAACTETERVWYEFFLMTGMREQEVIYFSARNVSFKGTVSMRWNPAYNWTPKAYKERTIPIPEKLLEALAAYDPNIAKKKGLLFHTESGRPKLDFLDCLKSIVRRTDMDPADWWLHKFRATFATWHLQAGVDIRTVQKWLGHSDLESTLRYLRPARGAGVQAKVNETFA